MPDVPPLILDPSNPYLVLDSVDPKRRAVTSTWVGVAEPGSEGRNSGNARRLASSWNACRAMTIEELEEKAAAVLAMGGRTDGE